MFSSHLALYLFTLGLAIIAIVVHHQFGPKAPSTEKTAEIPLENQYQWLTEQATLWQYRSDQQTIVRAEKIEYTDNGEYSKLSEPELYIVNERGVTDIRAKKGLTDRGQIISLSENVEMKQYNQQSPEQLLGTLKTERIEYHGQRDVLQSRQKVTIESEFGTTEAIGLEADLKNAEYRLLSQVKATYHMQSQGKTPPPPSSTP
ncbi:LPS export ABC transporter periplasmic protein LptC [Thiomicrorhabdus sp.]|uniref:LPS export ABC transporter periplasmic protein LptC n=1 Tax=Thiomicrorhabdus sp. TaxID=2039724 RepID=UPI0029C6C6A9|nr:LPS export ABC transporter periplasmic protein LptC [Thiomicrorhabdus sp.]